MSESEEGRREVGLGPPVERGIPVIAERWRLPLLVAVLASCVAIFLAAIVYAVSR